jgi:hypothetical protein
MVRRAWLGVLLICVPCAQSAEVGADSASSRLGAEYQSVFFAVLEGAYRDGLSDEHLAILLTRNEPAAYEYFIYACPLCSPSVAALEAYRSRPERFYSFKGDISTFGSGIAPDIALLLDAEDDTHRLLGIRLLLRRWIEAYATSRNLDAVDRDKWKTMIESAAGEGERILRGYRESGSVHLTAPAFADEGDCAVCTGASEGAMDAMGWRGGESRLP